MIKGHIGRYVQAAVNLYSEDEELVVKIGTRGKITARLPSGVLCVSFSGGVHTYATSDELNPAKSTFDYPLAVV